MSNIKIKLLGCIKILLISHRAIKHNCVHTIIYKIDNQQWPTV